MTMLEEVRLTLLDALGADMLPFVIAAHRDSKMGASLLTPIQDLRRTCASCHGCWRWLR